MLARIFLQKVGHWTMACCISIGRIAAGCPFVTEKHSTVAPWSGDTSFIAPKFRRVQMVQQWPLYATHRRDVRVYMYITSRYFLPTRILIKWTRYSLLAACKGIYDGPSPRGPSWKQQELGLCRMLITWIKMQGRWSLGQYGWVRSLLSAAPLRVKFDWCLY
jgi:hypothetical protein